MRLPRSYKARDSLYPLLAGLIALAVLLPGTTWGLPSREDDRFLFGERAPWTGGEIVALAGGLDAASGRGADVDANPLSRGGGPILLNDTDAKRAEIVRRYRLMSHQPDEFINFAAIAGMAQRRDADPRLYQYGGLWIYPVTGLLGAAKIVGYVELRSDLEYYLDHPAEFGKFYVVARLYSAMWGAIGAGVVFVIVRRMTGSRFVSFCAAASFAMLPVVVTAGHEAKPHLAGAVLVMWAVLKGDEYVRSGRRREAILAGLLCGAAGAMVISMVVSFALLPVMGHLRWRRALHEDETAPVPSEETIERNRDTTRAHAGVGTLVALLSGLLLYAITNPYVLYRAIFDRSVFTSNLGNSTAMYQVADLVGGVTNGLMLLIIAAGALTAIALATAIVVLIASRTRLGSRSWLLITAGIAVLAFFLPLGAGKPPEYARFGIVPMTVLLVAYFAVVGRGLFPLPRRRLWLAALGLILAVITGAPYIANFVDDSGPYDTRLRAAALLERTAAEHAISTLRLGREPAPWSVPPFDLWKYRAVLGSADEPAPVVVMELIEDRGAADDSGLTVRGRYLTPISWANKPVMIGIHPARMAEPATSAGRVATQRR